MIEIRHDNVVDILEDEIEDVNVGIHKEYDMLVFRYANLLSQFLELSKKYNDAVKELTELKEMHRNRSVRFCGYFGEGDDLK